MRRLGLVALVAGCHPHAEPPPISGRAPPPALELRFALADNADETSTVRIVHLARGALTVERTYQLPAVVSEVMWSGRDPIVWLERDIPWRGRFYDNAHDNEMGVLEPTGYRVLGAIAWPETEQPTGEDTADPVSWMTLVAAANGETWQGHCSWYGGPDGGGCVKMTYARRIPEPVIYADEVTEATADLRLPKIAPSKSVAVTISRHLEPDEIDDGGADEQWGTLDYLHCTRDGKRIEWPTARSAEHEHDVAEPFSLQHQDVKWISTEPPIYQLDLSIWGGVGMQPEPDYAVWEGCARSAHYTAAFGGPDDSIVIVGARLAIHWHGGEIAAADIPGTRIAFAPRP